MVGSQAEHGGIIKDGAKMVNAMANSVVPKFTVIMVIPTVQGTMPWVVKHLILD